MTQQIVAREPLIGDALIFEQAFLKSGDERLLYEMREKGRSDIASLMYNAVNDERHQIAMNMLAEGLLPELIAKVTGLSLQQIKNITTDGVSHG
jgi:predicted transposase YdaD